MWLGGCDMAATWLQHGCNTKDSVSMLVVLSSTSIKHNRCSLSSTWLGGCDMAVTLQIMSRGWLCLSSVKHSRSNHTAMSLGGCSMDATHKIKILSRGWLCYLLRASNTARAIYPRRGWVAATWLQQNTRFCLAVGCVTFYVPVQKNTAGAFIPRCGWVAAAWLQHTRFCLAVGCVIFIQQKIQQVGSHHHTSMWVVARRVTPPFEVVYSLRAPARPMMRPVNGNIRRKRYR